MARKIDELPEDNCNQTQLQKKFLQTLHLLIAQENVYDDLHDTMFLKDPVNFFNTLNSVIQKISICITKLEHNLDREHLDYLMLFKDVHDLMGHGSCIGIKILRDACKTMLSCALMKNTEGCSKCLVTVKTAFIDVRQKLHLLFEIEQKLLTAGWTIPPSNVIYLPPSFDTLIDKRDVHNEFGHLLFLKNQSTIEDFNNFLTLVVQDTSILLDDLETNLLSFEEDEINFLKMYMDLHVAMGHSSCIGANILKKEFHAVLTCTKSKYIEGIPSYLAEAKKELFNIVRKLSFFFEYNAGRSPNYKSEATEVNYNHEATQMQNLYEYHIKVLLDEGILNNTFAELQLKSSPNSVNEIFDNFFDFVHGKLHDLGKLVKCEVKDFSLIKTFLGELIEPCSRVGAEAILSACVSLRILTKDQRQEGLAESWIQLVHASKNFKDKMKLVLALRSIDAAVNLPIKLPINTEIGASFARYQLEFISSAEELLDKGIVTRLFDDSADNPGFLAFTLNQLFDETGSLLDKSASLLEDDLESILQIDGNFLDKVRDIRDRSFYIGLNRLHSAFESFLIYFDANFFEDTWYKNCIKCLAQARNALVEAKAKLGGFLMLQEKLVKARGSVPKLRSKHTSAKHT